MPDKHKHTLQHHRKPNKPKGVKHAEFHKVYWPYLPLLLVAAIGLVFASFSSASARNVNFAHGNVLAYATSMSIGGLLSATNTERTNVGKASLTLNSKLNSSAQAKANDMATRNYWSHNTPEGDAPWVFIDNAGYSYQKVGENLATGFSDEQATINGWMNSPGHRDNMLDTAFSEVGFGFANNANYTSAGGGNMTIVVAHYGQPLSGVATPATCAAGQTGTPPNCVTPTTTATKPASSSNTPPSSAASPAAGSDTATPTPAAPAAEKATTVQLEKKQSNATPVTTAAAKGYDPPTIKTSTISSLFSNPSAGAFAAGLTTATLVAAAGLWVGRHAIRVRRVIVHGEQFVMSHPVVDVAMLALVAASYMLTQTAGLIK